MLVTDVEVETALFSPEATDALITGPEETTAFSVEKVSRLGKLAAESGVEAGAGGVP